jgi:hypothetical protein
MGDSGFLGDTDVMRCAGVMCDVSLERCMFEEARSDEKVYNQGKLLRLV